MRNFAAPSASWRRTARAATWCRWSIPRKRAFPYAGRIEFVEPEGGGRITAGRAETWRTDYQGLLANHRAALRAECEQFGWSFTIHRTDRGPTGLLFAIHARMGAGAQAVVQNRQTARSGAGVSA